MADAMAAIAAVKWETKRMLDTSALVLDAACVLHLCLQTSILIFHTYHRGHCARALVFGK